MEQIVVLKKDGSARCNLRSQKDGIIYASVEREARLMSNDTISVVVHSVNSVGFTVGDYIEVDGSVYRMNQAPKIVRDERTVFEYTLVFESAKYDLANVQFLLPEETVDDYLTANLGELLQIIVDNANRVYADQWARGTYPRKKDVITEQFTEMNCLQALQTLVEDYGYQFRVVENAGVKTINVFEQGEQTDVYLEYGRAKGLYAITREATTSEDIITRLYVYGSNENLPAGYNHSRLCLPYSGQGSRRNASYIEKASAVAAFGVKEGIAIFEDEKPNCSSKVTSTVAGEVTKFVDTNNDFDIEKFWEIDEFTEYCLVRGYDPNSAEVQTMFEDEVVGVERKYLVGGKATITFNSGDLEGRSFPLNAYDHNTHTFTLDTVTENNDDEILRQTFPNNDLRPRTGDEYVISDIYLPYSRITDAETSLQSRANDYYDEHSKVCARYSVVFDAIYLKTHYPNGFDVKCGDYVHVKDTEIGLNAWIKVERVSCDYVENTVEIEVSDIKPRDPNAIGMYTGEYYREIVDINGNAIHPTSLSCILTPNLNGSNGHIDRRYMTCGEGILHNYSLAHAWRSWNLYDRVVDGLVDAYDYDVYVKASRRTQDAWIFCDRHMSPMEASHHVIPKDYIESRRFAEDPNFYYLKIGYLSIPQRRSGSMRKLRTLTLEYGQARIVGNDVVGGDIIITNDNNDVVIDTTTEFGRFTTLKVKRTVSGTVLYRDAADTNQVAEVDAFARNAARFRERTLSVTMQPNYRGAATKFFHGAGVYHNRNAAAGISDWNIDAMTQASILTPNVDYYVYVIASYTDRNDAKIVLSDSLIADTDTHFADLVGLMHAESSLGNRLLETVVGGTELNADFVRGGVLRDDGDNEIIDVSARRINGATHIKRADNTTAYSLNDEVASARAARKVITGSETGTYQLKDGNNNDIDIQSVLGATPTTSGGLRQKVAAAEATIGDANSGLVKDVNDTQAIVGGANSGLIQKVNQLVSNMNILQQTFNGYHASICDDHSCTQSATIILPAITPMNII